MVTGASAYPPGTDNSASAACPRSLTPRAGAESRDCPWGEHPAGATPGRVPSPGALAAFARRMHHAPGSRRRRLSGRGRAAARGASPARSGRRRTRRPPRAAPGGSADACSRICGGPRQNTYCSERSPWTTTPKWAKLAATSGETFEDEERRLHAQASPRTCCREPSTALSRLPWPRCVEGPLEHRVVEPSAGRGHLRWSGPRDFDPRPFERRDEALTLAGAVHHDRRRLVLCDQGGDLVDDPAHCHRIWNIRNGPRPGRGHGLHRASLRGPLARLAPAHLINSWNPCGQGPLAHFLKAALERPLDAPTNAPVCRSAFSSTVLTPVRPGSGKLERTLPGRFAGIEAAGRHASAQGLLHRTPGYRLAQELLHSRLDILQAHGLTLGSQDSNDRLADGPGASSGRDRS